MKEEEDSTALDDQFIVNGYATLSSITQKLNASLQQFKSVLIKMEKMEEQTTDTAKITPPALTKK